MANSIDAQDHGLIPVGARVPRRGNRFSRWLGRGVLRAMGWRIEGEIPDLPKMIAIGAPHTSNIDGVLALATLTALGIDAAVMGKHTLFWPPLGAVMRWFGVFPVDRGGKNGVVAETAATFAARDRMLLVMAPEGTRKAASDWRRGFWLIARAADAPILPAAIDYRGKRVVIGAPMRASEDFEADMRRALEFYGRYAWPARPERLSAPMKAALGLSDKTPAEPG